MRLDWTFTINLWSTLCRCCKKLGHLLTPSLLLSVNRQDVTFSTTPCSQTQYDTSSYTMRGQMEACLLGDAAVVTLPFNKLCYSQKQPPTHNLYTYAAWNHETMYSYWLYTSYPFTVFGSDTASPPFFSTPLSLSNWRLWEPDNKRDVGWGRGVWEGVKGMFQDAIAKFLQYPWMHPHLSLSHTHTNTLGECFLCCLLSR